ncbi:MAG: trigger factor [Planctomycetota bacterium]|nr:trigger factor [Planctomycetota bacterium]
MAQVAHSVVIEDAGPSRKRLKFTIPASEVNERLSGSLDSLAANAALPGFRPGRAPRRLIERKFGQSIREEAKNQLVAGAYQQAIKDHKLNVLGDPESNDELAALQPVEGRDLIFHVEVEVMPEFEVPSVDGVEVFKPTIIPGQEDVDAQLQRMMVNEGSLEPRERAERGDYCVGRGTMRDGASQKVLLDLNGAVIQVPPADKQSGAILGVMVDDFAKQVGTPAAGETVTVRCKGPEAHESEEIRGKDLVIEFAVEQVQRIVPAQASELVGRLGMGSEEQLREAMMSRLQQRALIEQQSAMRQQIAKHLLDKVELALPQRLTARQAERNLQMARLDLMYRGFDEQAVEERMAQLRANSAAAAVRDLKLTFILAKLAQALQVQVSQEEVLGRISQLAMERGVRPDAFRQDLEKQNQIGFVIQQVREHKTVDAVLARAKVTEIPLAEFNAKFGISAPKG